MKASVVSMNPKRAQELLDTAPDKQRNIEEARVQFYAKCMRGGTWRENGEAFIVNDAGELIDGQHRCLAVIAANVQFQAVLVTAVAMDAFASIDTGKSRGAKAVFEIASIKKHSCALASAVRWIYRWEHNRMAANYSGATKPSNEELLDFFNKRKNIYDAVAVVVKLQGSLKGKIPFGLAACLYWLFSKKDAGKCHEFFCRFADGLNLTKDHPVYLLRRLMETRTKRNLFASEWIAAVTVKAWNAFLHDRPLIALKWAATESFPEIEK